MDPITAAIETVMPSTKFQIFSGILKASRSSDGRMRLHGVASSTTKDLHGDTMQSSAIEDMERAANNNLTIFLNHSYDVPEDVAGSVESARMKTRGADTEGNPNYDLDMDILVNDANERAVKAFEAIERGTKLGLSIGALIPEGGAKKEKGGNYIIEHVELLETSLVGIPANPRSWVEYAAKSLRGVEKDGTTVPIGQPTLTLDGSRYKIEGNVEGLHLESQTTTVGDTSQTTTTINSSAEPVTPEITDATCPTCGKAKAQGGDCGNPFHKSVDPDVADAQVTIIQIDTGDGSSSSDSDSTDASAPQDGSSTNPDTGDEDHLATGDDAIAITAELNLENGNEAIQKMLGLLETTTRELVETKGKVTELTASVSTLTTERDTATAQRDLVLVETKRVLDNLADTPLMRKAVVIEAERELRSKFSGIYSEDFLKMLETPK
jgi:HK97 family phage prohead protease